MVRTKLQPNIFLSFFNHLTLYFGFYTFLDICKKRIWPVTRIPGMFLKLDQSKKINKLVTRNQCMKYCLYEIEFKCRSISFIVSHKNNRNRYVRMAWCIT